MSKKKKARKNLVKLLEALSIALTGVAALISAIAQLITALR